MTIEQALPPTDAVHGAVASTDVSPLPVAPAMKERGFDVGGLRVRYLRPASPMGWGHDEGDSTTRTVLELATIYEGERRAGFRLVVGKHSFWVLF